MPAPSLATIAGANFPRYTARSPSSRVAHSTPQTPTAAMIRIAVLGASGYAARELLRLMLAHPEVKITALASRQEGEPHIADVHPILRGRLDLKLENLA